MTYSDKRSQYRLEKVSDADFRGQDLMAGFWANHLMISRSGKVAYIADGIFEVLFRPDADKGEPRP